MNFGDVDDNFEREYGLEEVDCPMSDVDETDSITD